MCSLVTLRVKRPMWMRVGRGVGDFSLLRRIELERERDRLWSLGRLALSRDFERADDPLRLTASRSVLKRTLSRDLGRSFPSFSFESTFRALLRLLDLD